nr:MAG TPA: hypothetical protein [Bacteriophage sp.]
MNLYPIRVAIDCFYRELINIYVVRFNLKYYFIL